MKIPSYFYEYDDSCIFFVSFIGTTQELAREVGLKEGGGASGVVLAINNYSGFADPNIWEWLRNNDRGI